MAPLRRISRAWRSTQKKSKQERGAALVEFALVAPFFFFVVFAGIELGFMFRSYLTLEDSSRTAARVASIERSDTNADVAILGAINGRLEVLNGDLERVIIFRADTLASDLDDLPSNSPCLDVNPQNAMGECTVYDKDAFEDLVNGTTTGTPSGGFEPADRMELRNIGIHIEYKYNFVTGFLGDITLSTTSVEVVELNL